MIIVGILVVGLVVSLIIWLAHLGIFGLHLVPDVKPLEVVSLGINVSIALLLQYYLANKTKDQRSEKDLLLGNLSDIITTLRALRDSLYDCQDMERIPSADRKLILNLFRRLSNGIGHLESGIKLSHCKKLHTELEPIWAAYQQYKVACTSSPFPRKATPITEQDRGFDALSTKLQALLFKINKHR